MRAGQRLREDLQWRAPAVRRAGPVVEAVGDRVELFLRVGGQVRALGQALAQQPVGVLGSAALPRAVQVAVPRVIVGEQPRSALVCRRAA